MTQITTEDCGYYTPCWLWQGAVNTAGYGTRGEPGNTSHIVQTHRYEYELVHGPLRPDQVLHHLCEQKRCLRVDHLEPITRAQHMRLHRAAEIDMPLAFDLFEIGGGYQKDIATYLGASHAVLSKRFAGRRRGGRSGIRMSLRQRGHILDALDAGASSRTGVDTA